MGTNRKAIAQLALNKLKALAFPTLLTNVLRPFLRSASKSQVPLLNSAHRNAKVFGRQAKTIEMAVLESNFPDPNNPR